MIAWGTRGSRRLAPAGGTARVACGKANRRRRGGRSKRRGERGAEGVLGSRHDGAFVDALADGGRAYGARVVRRPEYPGKRAGATHQ